MKKTQTNLIPKKLKTYNLPASSGFTLIEALLSISLIAVLAGVGIGSITRFQNKNDLDLAVRSVAEALRRSEELSKGSSGDSSWGVNIASSTITVFRGPSFASRTSALDEITTISENISVIGVSEFVFSRLFATTTNVGTTTLYHTLIGESGTINVNGKGVITY